MDAAISNKEKESMIEFVLKDTDVLVVEDFYTIPVGYKYVVVFTIGLDGNMSTFASHQIADQLERDMIKKFKKIYKAIIHVNPVEKDA